MNSEERQAILVVGMHRSGTSALTGLLGAMGCSLPQDIMAASDMNERGFFESNKISYFNDDLLKSAGMTWYDLHRFPESWYLSNKAAELRAQAAGILEAEYGKARLIVIKDPRICRLIPFWRQVLEDAGYAPLIVLTHRSPLEVSGSLSKWAGYEPN